jgi:hypothetical protein
MHSSVVPREWSFQCNVAVCVLFPAVSELDQLDVEGTCAAIQLGPYDPRHVGRKQADLNAYATPNNKH